WMKVKEWLASGAIGRWHLAEFSVHRTMADPGRVAVGTPWRGTSAAGRGGVLLDHGTHLVYQLLDIAGMPASVSAWTGRLRHPGYEVEDTASLRFEYPGRLVTMFFTWAARARERRVARVRRRPERHHGRDRGRRVRRKLQLLLFVCGSAVFAYLVARTGVEQLLGDAVRTGWWFVPILLLYSVVCACNAGAWW